MIRLTILAALMALSACAGPRYTEVHDLGTVRVIYADYETINEMYEGPHARVLGYAEIRDVGGVIVCEMDDDTTCGHELKHLTKGRFHE